MNTHSNITFRSGVKFRFQGGSEQLYVQPVREEILALEQFVSAAEKRAAAGEKLALTETPKSEYLPKIGRRRYGAAGCSGAVSVDAYGKSALQAEWDALVARLSAVTEFSFSDR